MYTSKCTPGEQAAIIKARITLMCKSLFFYTGERIYFLDGMYYSEGGVNNFKSGKEYL